MALVVDPVCGMEFDHRSAWDRSVYQGCTYHFCHPVCKEIFDSNPTKFLSQDDEVDDDPAAIKSSALPEMPKLDIGWSTSSARR